MAQRKALVLDNSYPGEQPTLRGCHEDAEATAVALGRYGCAVAKHTAVDRARMLAAPNQFEGANTLPCKHA